MDEEGVHRAVKIYLLGLVQLRPIKKGEELTVSYHTKFGKLCVCAWDRALVPPFRGYFANSGVSVSVADLGLRCR